MQRPGQLVKFLGVLWFGETNGMPETVFEKKTQAYPHPVM